MMKIFLFQLRKTLTEGLIYTGELAQVLFVWKIHK